MGTCAATASTTRKHVADPGAGRERRLGGGLDRRTVHDRVGVREADLDGVDAGVDQRADEVHRLRHAGETGRQVAHQRGPALASGRPDRVGDRPHRCSWSRSSPNHSRGGVHVLVAPPGQADQQGRVRPELTGHLLRSGERMGALDGGDDALGAGEQRHRVHRLGVADRPVRRSAGLVQPGMFGADAGVVEAGRDGVRLDGLAVVVLEQVGPGAVQHADLAGADRGRMPAGLEPVAAGLEPVQPDIGVPDEGGEQADRVGPAADTRQRRVGKRAGQRQQLGAGLVTDAAGEVTHQRREGMRPGGGAQHVVRRVDVGDPVAKRLVDGVLQRPAAVRDRDDLGAEHPHPGHVQRLPLGVDLAHVDDAVQPEVGARGCRGDAVLAGSGLGDHPLLAHPDGEQRLAEHVADLVRPGVVEVLALEVDVGAHLLGEPRGVVEAARQPGVLAQQACRTGRGKPGRPSPAASTRRARRAAPRGPRA